MKIRENLKHVLHTPHVSYVLKNGKAVHYGKRTYCELRTIGRYGLPCTTRVRLT